MKQIWPALAAVGGVCTLIASPAAALELGELTVESQLGQPLRASIAYALQPNEQLQEYCIFLKPGVAGNDLPSLTKAKISVTRNAIRLRGTTPVREPMLGLQVSVNCPYTANLQRDYVMFFDFKAPAQQPLAERSPSGSDTTIAQPDRTVLAETRRTVRRTAPARVHVEQAPLPSGSRYQVQPGDTLSTIVARISDRPSGLWPAVEAVFAANPQAFIDGDINLLKAGSWLQIPDLYQALGTNKAAGASVVAGNDSGAATTGSAATYTASESLTNAAGAAFDSGFSGSIQKSDSLRLGTLPATNTENSDVSSPAATRTGSPGVGEMVNDGDSPFVSPVGDDSVRSVQEQATVMIPDTKIPVPDMGLASAKSESRDAATGSWSFLAWLGGAGLAIFLALLLFGRSFRQRRGAGPAGAIASSARSRLDEDAVSPDTIQPATVDFEFAAVSSDAPSMSLDADLELGTGLNEGSDMDIARDFGFSASDDLASEIDLELPRHNTQQGEDRTTDILPSNPRNEYLVVENELPPGEDDDYDMSMIVDATRQPVVDSQQTAKDLKAVPVESADDDEDDEEYTLSREIDYKILEQDYEEEFTITQALNAELARAAMELADTAEGGVLGDTAEMPRKRPPEDRTVDLPVRTEVEGSDDERTANMEITAEMTATVVDQGDAVNDEGIVDLDDTGINEARTATLLHADNDVTVEMDSKTDRIDIKKTRAS
jgi:hypothetical protein